MSFFDEGDEPRTTATRPRRPAASSAPPGDPDQQILVRRAVAAGGVLLLCILLIFGVRGCLSSQKQRALKDYNRDVTALAQESDSQVSKPFFQALSNGGGQEPLDLQTNVNQLKAAAESLVKRAKRLDPPDEMKTPQRYLVDVLELRRDGIDKIAGKLPTATASEGADEAIVQITGQMQVFLTSDIIFSQRVIPYIQRALDNADIGGQTIPQSRFLPNISWLDEATVAQRLGSTAPAGGSAQPDGPVAPGDHGHSLDSVAVGTTDLTADGSNRIPAGADLAFTVKFTNAGENDERNVMVKITIEGSGRPITAEQPVPESKQGEEQTVTVRVPNTPPLNTPVRVKVEVVPVPGEDEEDAANNSAEYPAIFTT